MGTNSKLAVRARINRRIHKWISIPFVFFLTIIGITAILLAWKKELGLIPKTQTTQVENPGAWIPVEIILKTAQNYATDSLQKNPKIDRLDFRPEKGIIKVIFKHHFSELQIDGYSGEILSVSSRNSDLIEKIHDGSIVDYLLKSSTENSKLIYSTLTSLVLITLCISGFYLWYYPKKMKKSKLKPQPKAEAL
jgi:uncharacterized iron-regulated membrane protein